jgi:hypothetical protein
MVKQITHKFNDTESYSKNMLQLIRLQFKYSRYCLIGIRYTRYGNKLTANGAKSVFLFLN